MDSVSVWMILFDTAPIYHIRKYITVKMFLFQWAKILKTISIRIGSFVQFLVFSCLFKMVLKHACSCLKLFFSMYNTFLFHSNKRLSWSVQLWMHKFFFPHSQMLTKIIKYEIKGTVNGNIIMVVSSFCF